jgi:hypothetical protein
VTEAGEAGVRVGSRLDGLGLRAWRRPSPRVGVTLGAVGSGLIVVGALAESGNRLGDGSGSPNRVPGILICAVVVVAGYVVVAQARRGPLATAGVAASALAVPPLMFFVTLDVHATPPLSLEAILFVSTAVWIASYVFGPGRGHGFYLGAGLLGLWLFVLEEVEGVLSFPLRIPQLLFGSSSVGFGRSVPSTSTTGALSLIFGVGYLLVGSRLDRRERRGIATPFMLAGLISLFWGIALLSGDLEEVGTGIALIIAGVGVAILGATAERRATTWVGGLAVFFGCTLLAAKIADTNTDAFAAAAVLLGVLVIMLGNLFVVTWGEPDETLGGPTTFRSQKPPPPPPPAPLETAPSAGYPVSPPTAPPGAF